MADNKPAEQAKNAPASSTPRAHGQEPAAQPRQGNSGQRQEPGDGLRDAVQAAHRARTTVPGFDGVDARLDNRTGADRPPLEEWPAKPQQIDGPDVAGQLEHTRRVLSERESADAGNRKGQFSPGPHGLSDTGLRETGSPVYGTESVEDPKG